MVEARGCSSPSIRVSRARARTRAFAAGPGEPPGRAGRDRLPRLAGLRPRAAAGLGRWAHHLVHHGGPHLSRPGPAPRAACSGCQTRLRRAVLLPACAGPRQLAQDRVRHHHGPVLPSPAIRSWPGWHRWQHKLVPFALVAINLLGVAAAWPSSAACSPGIRATPCGGWPFACSAWSSASAEDTAEPLAEACMLGGLLAYRRPAAAGRRPVRLRGDHQGEPSVRPGRHRAHPAGRDRPSAR